MIETDPVHDNGRPIAMEIGELAAREVAAPPSRTHLSPQPRLVLLRLR